MMNVQAIIDTMAFDMTDPSESGKDSDPDKPSLEKMAWLFYNENPEIWEEASPLNYVDDKHPQSNL
jgi:hypothetical protein